MNPSEAKRIIDHAFVPPKDGQVHDECRWENCRMPELMHEWTVEDKSANPRMGAA